MKINLEIRKSGLFEPVRTAWFYRTIILVEYIWKDRIETVGAKCNPKRLTKIVNRWNDNGNEKL